jgi:hypothetical protein
MVTSHVKNTATLGLSLIIGITMFEIIIITISVLCNCLAPTIEIITEQATTIYAVALENVMYTPETLTNLVAATAHCDNIFSFEIPLEYPQNAKTKSYLQTLDSIERLQSTLPTNIQIAETTKWVRSAAITASVLTALIGASAGLLLHDGGATSISFIILGASGVIAGGILYLVECALWSI